MDAINAKRTILMRGKNITTCGSWVVSGEHANFAMAQVVAGVADPKIFELQTELPTKHTKYTKTKSGYK